MRDQHNQDNQNERRDDLPMTGHADPRLDAAIRALRELPPENPDKVAQIVAAARAQRGVGMIPNSATRSRRNTFLWQGIGTAAAAALVFGIGFVTGTGNGVTPAGSEGDTGRQVASGQDTRQTVVSSGSTEGGDDELLPLPAPSAPSLGTFASNNDGGTGSSAPVPTAFRFKAANAKQVAIVGDFNAWDPSVAPLIRNADGTWGGTVALLPGRHTYAFMIDGRIVPDPTAINVRDPDYDVIVSTIVVREPGQ